MLEPSQQMTLPPQKKSIDKGTRAINFLIDVSVIYFSAMLIRAAIQLEINPNVLVGIIYFFYYLLFESISGQTLGKMITGTWVRDLKNEKPHFGRIFLRTFLRYNPFDITSYLFGQEQGTHDILSRTRLRFKDEK